MHSNIRYYIKNKGDVMNIKIGKLVQVDLREVWAQEASDFSQWLSQNLEYLTEVLDMNLELLETEKKLDDSRFSIDIWAEDGNEQPVIIENQLEKTDHTHLGQIITYATNMDVSTVIWIAKHPRVEHINAINWLNEFSDKNFYLLQVEAYKIDDSRPAPFFSVICRPSEEAKNIGKSKKEFLQEREKRRARRAASDTIIVPAKKDGFEKVFLGENSWYSIRIREDRIPQIKYIAAYQVAPVSAITHLAEVKEIIPSHEDPNKYKLIFKGPAKEIKPIPMGEKSKIQGPAYCIKDKIDSVVNIDELLGFEDYEYL